MYRDSNGNGLCAIGGKLVSEYKYMRNMIKTNLMLAKRFSNTMRYIDDLLTLNKTSFHLAIDHIYPQELKLKKSELHCHT